MNIVKKIEDVSVGNTMKQPTVPSWFPASSCPGRSRTSSIGTDLWSNVVDVVVCRSHIQVARK